MFGAKWYLFCIYVFVSKSNIVYLNSHEFFDGEKFCFVNFTCHLSFQKPAELLWTKIQTGANGKEISLDYSSYEWIRLNLLPSVSSVLKRRYYKTVVATSASYQPGSANEFSRFESLRSLLYMYERKFYYCV